MLNNYFMHVSMQTQAPAELFGFSKGVMEMKKCNEIQLTLHITTGIKSKIFTLCFLEKMNCATLSILSVHLVSNEHCKQLDPS